MVRRKIIWSKRAKNELFEILDFFNKRNGSNIYSKKLYSNLKKTIRILEFYPEVGLKTDIDNIRVLIHGNYSIFYSVDFQYIKVVSIWDDRQNSNKLNLD